MVPSDSPRARPGWAADWDPHPLCWLGGILRNRYGHRLGFRYAGDDGLALDIGPDNLEVVLVPRPGHPNGVHDVRTLNGDQVFGCLVWIELSRLSRTPDRTALVLGNGTPLRIHGTRGNTHVLRSPDGYLVHASQKVADLPALVQVARMLDWTVREPHRALDDDPDYWRQDTDAPFAVLLGVLDELREPGTAADLYPRLVEAPERQAGAPERLRQFKPQLRQALRTPGLVPDKAVRQAAGSALGGPALGDPALDDTDPHQMFVELWRKLYPDEALP